MAHFDPRIVPRAKELETESILITGTVFEYFSVVDLGFMKGGQPAYRK